MSNPFRDEPTTLRLSVNRTHSDPDNGYDDDDDDDDAYDDDEEGVSVTGGERWCSCAGFASPEWWSRH